VVSASSSLLAHGVPLTPASAATWGWLFLGSAGLLASVAVLRGRRGPATRLLTGAALFGALGLCFSATAEALGRGAGWEVLLAIWAVFPVLLTLAGVVLTRVPVTGSQAVRPSRGKPAEPGAAADRGRM
jgi:hypothetical protein